MTRMHVMARAALFLVVAAVIAAPPAAAQRVAQWQDELPVRQPWLRDHLPDDALMYLRVPHPFGILATPKGSVLDPALRSEANVQNVKRIRQGIVDNVLMHVPMFADLRLRAVEEYLRSPVEIGVFIAPAPAVLLAANIAASSNREFEDIVEALGFEMPGFGLAGPLDEDGFGLIETGNVPLHVQFDAGSGRLLVQAGPAVTQETFAATTALLVRDTPHRMRAMEARIDASGQGLFFWIDAEQAVPAMKMFMQPEQFERLEAFGLDKVSAAAAGFGVANGKGRLAVLADLPEHGERGFVPRISNRLNARVVGRPDAVMLLSVPGPEELARMEALALERADNETRTTWADFKAGFADLAGMQIEEALGAIGPDIAFIFDEAGDYAALRLRDPEQWERLVANLSAAAGSKPDSRRIGGNTIYHISTPNELGLLDEVETEEMGWGAVLMRRQRDHVYWMRDRDYLYMASTPQVLIDRAALRARTDLGEWLSDTQRIDAGAAAIAMTGTTRKLPKRMYSLYIEVLQVLADIAEVEIDVWSMPTPRQLRLPDEGSFGFTLSLGEPTLGMELTFENNPAEILSGAGGAATVGILAAIAIPAYQDYTVRAKVSQGLAAAGPVKEAVAGYYRDNGHFPGPAEAQALSDDGGGDAVESVTVEANTGRVAVNYVAGTVPDGGGLVFVPFGLPDGEVEWRCTSTIADKHTPLACRNDDPASIDDVL